MISKFLNAKHWQIFLLIFIIPGILYAILMFNLFSEALKPKQIGLEAFELFFNLFPVVIIFYSFILYGWYWSVVKGLTPKINSAIRPQLKWFNLSLLFPAIYTTVLAILIGFIFPSIVGFAATSLSIILILIPIHFLAIAGIFYCMYVVAKVIKMAELQREVNFGDFIGEFACIWILPIGIWFLQPKINELYNHASQ